MKDKNKEYFEEFKKELEKYSKNKEKSKGCDGWVCPKCGKSNAPWVRSCDCVAAKEYVPYPVPYYPDWTWRPYPYWPVTYTNDDICEGNYTITL